MVLCYGNPSKLIHPSSLNLLTWGFSLKRKKNSHYRILFSQLNVMYSFGLSASKRTKGNEVDPTVWLPLLFTLNITCLYLHQIKSDKLLSFSFTSIRRYFILAWKHVFFFLTFIFFFFFFFLFNQ